MLCAMLKQSLTSARARDAEREMHRLERENELMRLQLDMQNVASKMFAYCKVTVLYGAW